MRTINFLETLKEGIKIGLMNAPSLILCFVLYFLTIWIPYINIGTTIAISMLPVKLSAGEIINPLHIFESKYRRYIGEYILLVSFIMMAIFTSMIFLFVPAIVIAVSWSLSIYYLIDRNKNPMEAIAASNKATYGSKWAIFGVLSVIVIIFKIITMITDAIVSSLGDAMDTDKITIIIIQVLVQLVIVVLAYGPVMCGLNGSIWRQLKDNVE